MRISEILKKVEGSDMLEKQEVALNERGFLFFEKLARRIIS